MKRLSSFALILVVLLVSFGLTRDIYWRFLVKPIESAIVTLCGSVSAGQIFTAAQANCYRTTPTNDYNGNITDANISATAAISKSKISTASTWVVADLPTGIPKANISSTGTWAANDLPTNVNSMSFPVGSAAAPSINFQGQTTDGFFSKSATQIGEAINGVETGFTDSNGNMSRTGTYQSTKACASGFTRVAGGPPNYCRRNDLTQPTWADDVTTCKLTSTDPTLPTDAKFANIELTWQALSNNLTASRYNTVTFYSTTACTAGTDVAFSEFQVYEMTATAAGTVIGMGPDHLIVPVLNDAGVMKYATTQPFTAGNGKSDILSIGIEGYWD